MDDLTDTLGVLVRVVADLELEALDPGLAAPGHELDHGLRRTEGHRLVSGKSSFSTPPRRTEIGSPARFPSRSQHAMSMALLAYPAPRRTASRRRPISSRLD
jgi:hypothetical protein